VLGYDFLSSLSLSVPLAHVSAQGSRHSLLQRTRKAPWLFRSLFITVSSLFPCAIEKNVKDNKAGFTVLSTVIARLDPALIRPMLEKKKCWLSKIVPLHKWRPSLKLR
jgi:hypothetical protein